MGNEIIYKNLKVHIVSFLLGFILISCTSVKENNQINLAGEWKFQIDSNDVGLQQKWYNKTFNESVVLPGSMADNGKGFDVNMDSKWIGSIIDSSWFFAEKYKKYRAPGNIKVPFWLQPDNHYIGPAWYQKEVFIPSEWKGQQVQLYLERCHWESSVWFDNIFIGKQNSLGTPHLFSLPDNLAPGKHILTIRIDNSIQDINVGVNSHSISDHTQGSWNGIIGKIELLKKSNLNFEDVQLYPDIDKKLVNVKIDLSRFRNIDKKIKISVVAIPKFISKDNIPKPKQWEFEEIHNKIELQYPMGNSPGLWDEFNPNLYKMIIKIESNNTLADHKEITFGMRKLEVENTYFKLNGKRIFLRGTLDCAAFPKTGYPPTNKSSWLEIFKTIKAHGLNHVRYHSWCPPKAAFEAADELGIYLQVEASSWANQGSAIGDGKAVDQFIYEESERMLKVYGNHPSFCFMLYGNEPAGDYKDEYLAKLINSWKALDKRHIYSGGAGWPVIAENEFNNIPSPRIQGWGEGLNSIINGQKPKTDFDFSHKIKNYNIPVVSHEIGQWCVYPDFKEIELYSGNMKAKNFEIFKESLEENGLVELSEKFLLASGKLQALCYKAEIEAALRTSDFAGFQLLGLSDFPGQGTALVGVLNSFWQEKGYISAEEFKNFSGSTVPLVRLPKRIYTNNEVLEASVEVSHFGNDVLTNIKPIWTLSDNEGKIYAKGELTVTDIPLANGFQLGKIKQPLDKIEKPNQLVLSVKVGGYSNSWDLWVYPKENKKSLTSDIIVTQKLNEVIIKKLKEGAKVLLTPVKGSVEPEYGGEVEIGFSSIFWNTAWTKGQAPHTLGILCNPEHPVFRLFPTEYHSNWQWWDAMSHSNVIAYNNVSPNIKPIVQVIDDWFQNRPLALLFEVKVGKGKLLVSGIDLLSQNEKRIEARQLLFSLEKYMSEDFFNPNIEVDINIIKNIFIK